MQPLIKNLPYLYKDSTNVYSKKGQLINKDMLDSPPDKIVQ